MGLSAGTRLGRLRLLLAAALAVTFLRGVPAGAQASPSDDVIRLDPALDRLVPPGTKVDKLSGALQRGEGPLWMSHGNYLLLSDLNDIMKWSPSEGLSVWRRQTFQGPVPSGIRVGTNGLTLDRQGRLVAVEHGDRRVVRFENDGTVTVLADHYKGQRLNSPNDLVIKRNGDIYFTDPPYLAESAATVTEFRRETEVAGVYRVTAAGLVDLLVSDLPFPNGLAFSPDEKKLYVANTRPKKFMVYDVKANGSLREGKIFLDLSTDTADGSPDGMKVDRLGNIYAAGPGGVLVISPEGKHLGTIRIPEIVSNCAWGDADFKSLYITARTGLYRVHVSIPGIKQ